jgi:hypothetical protein
MPYLEDKPATEINAPYFFRTIVETWLERQHRWNCRKSKHSKTKQATQQMHNAGRARVKKIKWDIVSSMTPVIYMKNQEVQLASPCSLVVTGVLVRICVNRLLSEREVDVHGV